MAIAGILLLHVPPVAGSLNVIVCPAHTRLLPVIAGGGGLIVTPVVVMQPVPVVYVIATLPVLIPVIIPVALPAVAINGLLLLHIPPVVTSLSVVVAPTHIVVVPVIAAGSAYTVSVLVVLHPAPGEKVIVVIPAATPVTTPVPEPTVAIPGDPELHVPPPEGSLKAVVAPVHTVATPVIGAGSGLTVTNTVAMHPVDST